MVPTAATYITLSGAAAAPTSLPAHTIARGEQICALTPTPSQFAALPEPATVLTSPDASDTQRRRWLPVSATYSQRCGVSVVAVVAVAAAVAVAVAVCWWGLGGGGCEVNSTSLGWRNAAIE